MNLNTLRHAQGITLYSRDAKGYSTFDRYVGAEEAMGLIANGYFAHAGEAGYINMNTMGMRTTGYRISIYPPIEYSSDRC